MKEWSERRRVVFDHDMTVTMLRLMKRGWNREAIAERVGVGRDVLRAELRRHGLIPSPAPPAAL